MASKANVFLCVSAPQRLNIMTPHEQHLIDVICPALQTRNLIRIWYRNTTSGLQDWRAAEPYLIGSFPKKHIQLAAWFLPTPEQIMTGQKEGWRAYILKNISEVQVLETHFERTRLDYDPQGNGMKNIHCSAVRDPIMRIA